MALRLAHAPPAIDPVLPIGIGDKTIVAAGHAKNVLIAIGNQPVADIEPRIGAETNLVLWPGDQLPYPFVLRLQRMHGKIVRQKPETMIAPDAVPIVEMHDLIAVVACEKLHRLCLCRVGGSKMPAARQRSRHCT
jgi:hypothetical protein